MALDFVSCLEFGLLEARDITVKLPPGGEVNSVKLGRFGVSGWADGKIGEYAFENFELDAPDGHARFGEFALRGFNYKHVLDAVNEHLAQGIESFESADPRSFIPTLDQIAVAGVDLDVPDKKGAGPIHRHHRAAHRHCDREPRRRLDHDQLPCGGCDWKRHHTRPARHLARRWRHPEHDQPAFRRDQPSLAGDQFRCSGHQRPDHG